MKPAGDTAKVDDDLGFGSFLEDNDTQSLILGRSIKSVYIFRGSYSDNVHLEESN
jgi:hypothetical protein